MSFSFGGPSAPAPATSGFSFGSSTPAAPATTASAAPAGGFSFGGTAPTTTTANNGAAFNFASTSATTTAAAATPAAGGFSFGGSTPATATAATTPAAGGFSFGGSTPATTTAAATTPAAGGFSFGGSTPATTTAATTPAAGGFSFGGSTPATATAAATPSAGGFSIASTPATSTAATPNAASTTGGFGFTAAPSSTAAVTSIVPSTTTSAAGGFSFAGTTVPAATAAGVTSTVPATTSNVLAVPSAGAPIVSQPNPPAEYMGKTIEEIINMWSEELERHATSFTNEAVKVCNWDLELMETQKKIGTLANDCHRLHVENKELESSLDGISAYQTELRTSLEQLEMHVDTMYETQGRVPEAADIEREGTFQQAVDIDDQLNTMNKSLAEIVEKLNNTYFAQAKEENPTSQILKVLNVHHNALQDIESKTSLLNRDISELSRQVDTV